MLIRLFEQATAAERTRLSAMLGQPRAERSDEDVSWVRERMDGYGCIDYARQVAHGLPGAAHHEFTFAGIDIVPDSRDKRFIEALPSLGHRAKLGQEHARARSDDASQHCSPHSSDEGSRTTPSAQAAVLD